MGQETTGAAGESGTSGAARAEFAAAFGAVAAACTECQLCVKPCAFLQRHGTPKAIAARCDAAAPSLLAIAYECSLCGLCAEVCPVALDPAALFLEMRREAVARGSGDLLEHAPLLAYERRGSSRRYSLSALPAGCDTVFFPGCALAGTRSTAVLQLLERLQRHLPSLGVVLDCCTKPSHDLGRERYFHDTFDELRQQLLDAGVTTVWVACPNCYQVFRDHGGALQVRTLYEVWAELPEGSGSMLAGSVTLHDPCVVRGELQVQAAARSLLRDRGLKVEEMPSSGRTTLCCGEGGGVGFVAADLARRWTRRRLDEVQGRRLVTYCAGCSGMLGRHLPTFHLVDLLLDPQAALAGRRRATRPPFTYWRRLWLKRQLRRRLAGAEFRERDKRPPPRKWWKPVLLAVLLATALAATRGVEVGQWLEPEYLRGLIGRYGVLAPLAYMLLYTLAPALFLPGLPLTVVGGILFGPFWGVVYTIVSATAGACVAFLVSRYLARDWVAARLTSPRWRRLDAEVERHGWKVVAAARLIPVLPFNLLNYAFGLTRVRFFHYALATFFGMLPACVAYIVFSSTLLDLVRGRVSPQVLLGLAAVAAVSILPRWLRRGRRRLAPDRGD